MNSVMSFVRQVNENFLILSVYVQHCLVASVDCEAENDDDSVHVMDCDVALLAIDDVDSGFVDVRLVHFWVAQSDDELVSSVVDSPIFVLVWTNVGVAMVSASLVLVNVFWELENDVVEQANASWQAMQPCVVSMNARVFAVVTCCDAVVCRFASLEIADETVVVFEQLLVNDFVVFRRVVDFSSSVRADHCAMRNALDFLVLC